MLEDPRRCYDPGYAAGATLRRAGDAHSETICEQGLALRLESWAARHFAQVEGTNARDPRALAIKALSAESAYRQAAREHFRRGFRDGYWNRGRFAPLELVA